jgi:hypothetical protein
MLDVMVPEVAVMPIAVVLVPRTVANPAEVIPTSDGFAEVQVTPEVKVCVLPLLYVPTAAYCCWAPSPTLMLAGVTAIEVSVAADTALAFEIIPPTAAVIEVAALLLTSSVASPALVMLTVAGLDEPQVTEEVMFAVVPLLYVPTAEYCCVPLTFKITLAGVIAIEVSADATVTVLIFDLIEPEVAEMVTAVALLARSVARPVLPILTTAEFDEAQVTDEVMVAVVPLL